MDDLDKLKSIWQKAPASATRQKEDIARMLQGESFSVVSRLKRNVRAELLFTLITALALLYVGLAATNPRLTWLIWVLLAISLMYLLYYINKLRTLSRFSMTEGNLKNNLQNLTEALRGYLKFYRLSYVILYPAFFIAVLWKTAYDVGADTFFSAFEDTSFLLLFIGLASVILAASYIFTSWYLRKLYGNHLKKLQGILNQLTEMLKE